MADTSTSISGTVNVADHSKERVALELMKFIRGSDESRQDEILDLYARCLVTTLNPTMGVEKIKKLVRGQ